MTYLVAVTIAISDEMEAYHKAKAPKVIYCPFIDSYKEWQYQICHPMIMTEELFNKLSPFPGSKFKKQGMGMAYEAWNPAITKGIPTALCLN